MFHITNMFAKATDIEDKIPGTTGFINTLDINKLTKINFVATGLAKWVFN